MELLGKQLSYINEGNVHIVLQLKGTEYVLRIIKETKNHTNLKKLSNSVSFVNTVMIPLLCGHFNSLQEVLSIPEDDIKELCKTLHPLRPEKRRFKSELSNYAIKTLNLSLLSSKCETNYCIEIKPKEGFIASSLASTEKCFFCLKQLIKLKNKEIECPSQYCPLDLFSGDKERMKLALISLIDNPQNNFKIFQDCKIIYDDNSNCNFDTVIEKLNIFNSIHTFIEFLIEILLSNNEANEIKMQPIKNTANKSENCDSNNILKPDSFLHNLLSIQTVSENLNIDLTKVEEGTEYVEPLLTFLESNNLDLHLQNDKELFFETADVFHLALISAIARDCSIMISFSPDFVEGFPYIEVDDKKIPFRLAVTDLEPKNGKTLMKRRDNEKQMVQLLKMESESKIQPNTETRAKQLEAWQQLITDYLKANKQSTIDIRETQNSPLFYNSTINRKLTQEGVLTILESMAKCGKAMSIDKSKTVWEVYWHSLDEWGNMVYSWACNNGMNNSVCTIFELREGENTVDEEFHGLDMNVLLKALKSLQLKGKCELIEFDDNQGVKFF